MRQISDAAVYRGDTDYRYTGYIYNTCNPSNPLTLGTFSLDFKYHETSNANGYHFEDQFKLDFAGVNGTTAHGVSNSIENLNLNNPTYTSTYTDNFIVKGPNGENEHVHVLYHVTYANGQVTSFRYDVDVQCT